MVITKYSQFQSNNFKRNRCYYREQMPMMKIKRAMGIHKLSKNIAQWFSTPKPEEELYDISNDPYELKNLANNRELIDTLFLLRNILDQWIKKTADMGVLSEKEILESFFPEGKPPKLLPLSYKIENNLIILSHPNKGSSIIWKIRGDKSKSWNCL